MRGLVSLVAGVGAIVTGSRTGEEGERITGPGSVVNSGREVLGSGRKASAGESTIVAATHQATIEAIPIPRLCLDAGGATRFGVGRQVDGG